MALIDDVKSILNDLAQHGWKELFDAHGLNILASDLENELISKDISGTIQRAIPGKQDYPGFNDFAIEGKHGVTPGSPARSLVYHAMASPSVLWSDIAGNSKLSKFPTLEQIEVIENYVYGSMKTSLENIEAVNGKENLAIVVFANQYRTAIDSTHKKHADMVYSRTGVSRVGNADSLYDAQSRSFVPLTENKNEIRVLPAKYNAYLAVKMRGSRSILGQRFNAELNTEFSNTPKDEQLNFWYPVHKLFEGTECLEGLALKLDFTAFHLNEKIKKIHNYVANDFDFETGSSPSEHSRFPFQFSDGIASFNVKTNLVVPTTHEAVVAKAKEGVQPVSFRKGFDLPVEKGAGFNSRGNKIILFSSSISFQPKLGHNAFSTVSTGSQRSVPEYSHIRTKIDNGQEIDLNKSTNLIKDLSSDKYDALHYVDFTGDGFVSVALNIARLNGYTNISAYSIISPPDFFPYCEQSEIFSSFFGQNVWARPPQTLADIRILPNVKSHPELFFKGMLAYDTCSALLGGTLDVNLRQTKVRSKVERRVTYLTDGAAGFFAPGWDTSFDMIQSGDNNFPHLAAYGLGSPFPEDAKLCASISSFWPAVAPDTARSFWPEAQRRKTVIPLTDDEIGSNGSLGWDGEYGPTITTEDGKTIVTYKHYDYVDYTLNALNNKFDYHKLANIDSKEYIERVEKYLIARNEIAGRAILLGYTIDGQDDDKVHNFRFMLRQTEIQNNNGIVKLEVLSELRIKIGANNQVI